MHIWLAFTCLSERMSFELIMMLDLLLGGFTCIYMYIYIYTYVTDLLLLACRTAF